MLSDLSGILSVCLWAVLEERFSVGGVSLCAITTTTTQACSVLLCRGKVVGLQALCKNERYAASVFDMIGGLPLRAHVVLTVIAP